MFRQGISNVRTISSVEKEKLIQDILNNFDNVKNVIVDIFKHHDIPFLGVFVVDEKHVDTVKNLLNIGVVSSTAAIHEIAKQFTDSEEAQQIVMVNYVAYVFAMIEEIAKLLSDATSVVKKEKLYEVLAGMMLTPTFIQNVYYRMHEIVRMLCEAALKTKTRKTDTTIM